MGERINSTWATVRNGLNPKVIFRQAWEEANGCFNLTENDKIKSHVQSCRHIVQSATKGLETQGCSMKWGRAGRELLEEVEAKQWADSGATLCHTQYF